MSNVPDGLKYTKDHEWLRDNGDGYDLEAMQRTLTNASADRRRGQSEHQQDERRG